MTSAFGGQRSIQLSYGCSGRSVGAHHRQAGRRRQWAANAGRAARGAGANAHSSPWPSPPRRGGEGILLGGEERGLLPAPLTIVRCTGPGRWPENGGMRCATFPRIRSGGRGGAGAVRVPRAACRASRRRQPRRRGPRTPQSGRSASSHFVSPCPTLSRLISAYLTKKLPPVCLTSLRHEACRAAPNRVAPGQTASEVSCPRCRPAGRRLGLRGSARPAPRAWSGCRAPPAGLRPQGSTLVGGGASAILPLLRGKGRA